MLSKDELISRIRNLNSELSPQFLRGFSENVLSAYLCFLDIAAKFNPKGEVPVKAISTPMSPAPLRDPARREPAPEYDVTSD